MTASRESFRIREVRATPVSVPLAAPLRHAHGAHWGRFVRTIVEVETDDGLVGLGELGGGGHSTELAVRAVGSQLVGHDPFALEQLRFKVANPTAGLYGDRVQLLAALEFACLDLIGRRLGVTVSDLLGGRLRDRVPFASYLFFRYPTSDGSGEVRTITQLVELAAELVEIHGFRAHKLKGGVYGPEYELACYRALVARFPGHAFRYDPNNSLSVADARRFARSIRDCPNDYLEDPTWGLNGMRQVRTEGIPLATNTVVVDLEQLAANVRDPAVDVVLLDTTIWGGIRGCLRAAAVCDAFQLGIGVHSSGELGIQLATMLHLGAVLPSLTFTADAHYHHLADDVIAGGRLPYREGAIAVPDGPGLGVELDRDKLAEHAESFLRLGSYPYDRDPQRPDWFSTPPDMRWDDPTREGCS